MAHSIVLGLFVIGGIVAAVPIEITLRLPRQLRRVRGRCQETRRRRALVASRRLLKNGANFFDNFENYNDNGNDHNNSLQAMVDNGFSYF